jgi:DNA invertase Pin-like site-specific DNA recombinase
VQHFILIGYARVSKIDDHDTCAQVRALKDTGCSRIFEEHASGGRTRPELHRALDQLRERDVLVVWKLDRLSRSLKFLLHILEQIAEANAGFRSLTEHVDTTTVCTALQHAWPLRIIGIAS